MTPNLSNLEIELLRKLANGEAVTVSSHLRLRLEMAGLLRDRANGIELTPGGRRVADLPPPVSATDSMTPEPQHLLNSRGRRMPFRRRSVFE